jgi:hypothetical protein
MPNHFLAVATLSLHAVFVGLVVFGAIFALWRPWLLFLQVPAVLWGAYIELSGGTCPLTTLENRFRKRAGMAGYEESCLEHYLFRVLCPEGLTREAQLGLAALVMLVNVVLYLWLYARARSAA